MLTKRADQAGVGRGGPAAGGGPRPPGENGRAEATTQQLWQAAKLASVGELAASIAHELNNPLATVSLRLEVRAWPRSRPTTPRRRPLEIVEQEVERMARAGGQPAAVQPAPAASRCPRWTSADEVRKTIELIRAPPARKRQVAVDAGVRTRMPGHLADRQQLRQVFLNLLTNAADAMPQGGRLTLRVCAGELPRRGRRSSIEVADTGVGHPAGAPATGDRPVLHHQGGGQGDGAGAGHLPAHRPGAPRHDWTSRATSAEGRPSASCCPSGTAPT